MGFLTISLILVNMVFGSEKVFIACEGNFYEGNGTLWYLENDESVAYENNPLGDLVQSVYVYQDFLFVIANVSSEIHIFKIQNNGLNHYHTVYTDFTSPREMLVHDNHLYFTNWYSQDVKKLNLSNLEITQEFPVPGLPEDIIVSNGSLFVSITMNTDWTDGNLVVELDPNDGSIINSFNVGLGPNQLVELDNSIYVSRTFYDASWNAYFGTSKITGDDVLITNYTSGTICGGGIYKVEDSIYRVYDGGIVQIDNELQIMPETRIGNYGSDVYSVEVLNDKIYFGLSDFSAPDEVAISDLNGQELDRYEVGLIPGDFAMWSCSSNGDINNDQSVNVTDIVEIVADIIDQSPYNCKSDINLDGVVNVSDIIIIVQNVLNIESFRGAANWLNHNFPELNVYDRLKKSNNNFIR